MTSEKFCLRWNDFERNISGAFRDIRQEKEFFDITIACEDEQLQAHKVILSACSPFFKNILYRNHHQHPLLYLKGVSFKDMEYVLNFMYHGEVNVAQDDLNSFLQVAEDLKVKGLTQGSSGNAVKEGNKSVQVMKKPPAAPVLGSPPPPAKLPHPAYTAHTVIQQPPRHQEDDDIEEIVPIVKAEPNDLTPIVMAVPQEQSVAMYEDRTQQMDDSTMMAMGTEEYNDNYEKEYDGQYEEESFENPVAPGGHENPGSIPVQCPHCAKTMMRRNIARHISVKHTNTEPSVCSICQRQFKTKWSLKEHERKAHGVLQSQKDQFVIS